jgi:hypothetical protein
MSLMIDEPANQYALEQIACDRTSTQRSTRGRRPRDHKIFLVNGGVGPYYVRIPYVGA